MLDKNSNLYFLVFMLLLQKIVGHKRDALEVILRKIFFSFVEFNSEVMKIQRIILYLISSFILSGQTHIVLAQTDNYQPKLVEVDGQVIESYQETKSLSTTTDGESIVNVKRAAGDDCANPIPLTLNGDPVQVSFADATFSGLRPPTSCSDAITPIIDIWLVTQADADGSYKLEWSVIGEELQVFGYAIYFDDCLGSTILLCREAPTNSGGFSLSAGGPPNRTVYLQLWTYQTSNQVVEVKAYSDCTLPICIGSNETGLNCADAIPLIIGAPATTVDLTNATFSGKRPYCTQFDIAFPPSKDFWLKVQTNETGALELNWETTDDFLITDMALYEGCSSAESEYICRRSLPPPRGTNFDGVVLEESDRVPNKIWYIQFWMPQHLNQQLLVSATSGNNNCPEELLISNTIDAITHQASKKITSDGNTIDFGSTLFRAGETISLLPGFHAIAGSDFRAVIGDCEPINLQEDLPNDTSIHRTTIKETTHLQASLAKKTSLKIYPNPFISRATIEYKLSEAEQVQLALFDVAGRKVTDLERGFRGKGGHTITLQAEYLRSGIYFLKAQLGKTHKVEKVYLLEQ